MGKCGLRIPLHLRLWEKCKEELHLHSGSVRVVERLKGAVTGLCSTLPFIPKKYFNIGLINLAMRVDSKGDGSVPQAS